MLYLSPTWLSIREHLYIKLLLHVGTYALVAVIRYFRLLSPWGIQCMTGTMAPLQCSLKTFIKTPPWISFNPFFQKNTSLLPLSSSISPSLFVPPLHYPSCILHFPLLPAISLLLQHSHSTHTLDKPNNQLYPETLQSRLTLMNGTEPYLQITTFVSDMCVSLMTWELNLGAQTSQTPRRFSRTAQFRWVCRFVHKYTRPLPFSQPAQFL